MTSRNGPVLAYGELLWDVLPSEAVLGGAPANFTYRLQSLGQPARVVSRIGRDQLGNRALEQLHHLGVDAALIQRDDEYPTGTVDITLSAAGDASYVINTGVAYDHITLTEELRASARNCRALYFGSLIQRHEDSRRTLATIIEDAGDAVKLLDLNLRRDCFSLATVETSLQHADILKLNHQEAAVIAEMLRLTARTLPEFAQQIMSRFSIHTCLITRAEQGVYARSIDGQETTQAGYEVPVVDTIGSGDSFTAAFLQAFLAGSSLEVCCDAGNRLGALVAQRKGGMSPIEPGEVAAFGLPQRALDERTMRLGA